MLSDLPRSGNPGKFTPEQVTLILALACEPPEQSGRPITHWTCKELADEAQKRGIVASISESQVGRYLREAELQPHKSRYWLNAKEKDPEQFQQKVETVCGAYLEAPRLYKEENTHTVCTDEMTGIQALERIAATLPMTPGHTECREFEYLRHGTTTLIGNFHVVTGQLVAPTLGPTRTEPDFVHHVAQTVATDPTASWVFVVDNLNIHASEGLVEWVAKTCGIEQDLGIHRLLQRGFREAVPLDVHGPPAANRWLGQTRQAGPCGACVVTTSGTSPSSAALRRPVRRRPLTLVSQPAGRHRSKPSLSGGGHPGGMARIIL